MKTKKKTAEQTELFKLTHNEELIFEGTEQECYFKLQRAQSFSADWAIRYEGWKITPSKEKFNYYQSELKNINTKTGYAPILKITDSEGGKTKHLSINAESKDEIIKWLNSNF